jgi:GDP-L-fucose synthase
VFTKNSKIFIAGHKGLIGSSILRKLNTAGYKNLLVVDKKELNLLDQKKVFLFLKKKKPAAIIIAAARVGGIVANNKYRAEFIYENLTIQNNLIHSAFLNKIKNLIFLGSSCVYPKYCKQPIKEEYLLSGTLERTNEPYAIAKIAGIKMCESYNRQYGQSPGVDYRSVMPTNLYGPGDNYHPENSHVIPGLIRRFHEAKIANVSEVIIWGTGNARREFLFVDDMAAASVFIMQLDKATYISQTEPMQSHINVGFGSDVTIAELALAVAAATGYKGNISFDSSKPDGAIRKWMDSSRLSKLGYKVKVNLTDGLNVAYSDFLENMLN